MLEIILVPHIREGRELKDELYRIKGIVIHGWYFAEGMFDSALRPHFSIGRDSHDIKTAGGTCRRNGGGRRREG
jgi:hypothetical protein